jgi:Protein of unknown function (DUF3108)
MAERLSRLVGLGLPGRRRAAWLVLVAAVLLVHGGVMRQISARIAEFKLATTMPKRIEVAYVRELALAEPPPQAAVVKPSPPPSRPRAPKPARAASAPQAAASSPAVETAKSDPPPADVVAQAPPLPVAQAASAAAPEPVVEAPAASAAIPAAEPPILAPPPAAAVAGAASAPLPFDWPNSTRMSYALTGNYRGEVQGSAQVEWIRAGTRYQVHLDIVIGPSMAPLITRRMSSDGELTAEGLSPRRYDEDTKAVFRDRRRVTMHFEPDAVVMASGQRRERLPGVQDTASQFVQLTYLFTTRPELLRVGQQFEVPLALPRNIDRWTYDVVKEEILYTPFGEVPSFHVKPRRVSRPGGDLSIEIWFSPQLRYLPVRIRIEQDPETYLDLVLDRKPQIASP